MPAGHNILKIQRIFRLIRFGTVLGAACGLGRAQVPANLLPVVSQTGDYDRAAAAQVNVVAVSESGLILECSQKVAPGVQPFMWRERYAIRDGRLVLDAVLTPHIVPPQPAHTEWQVSSAIGTANIGPTVLDPHWKDYSDYLQGVIQTVQDAWSTQLADNKIASSAGSVVSVTFVMNSKGEIVQILGAHPSPQAPAGLVDPCVRAINMRAPYGGWTDAMISALGKEQQLTFSFCYQ
jgi:hypothetical protein